MTPIVYNSVYSALELPPGHRFPIEKYRKLYERICEEGATPEAILRPAALDPEWVKGPLCENYISRFVRGDLSQAEIRRIGFPWSETLVRRTFTSVAGTILAGQLSLERGRAINLAGGYHHAFYDLGTGFCIVNDLYLSALNLLQQPGIGRVLIFDCDVHQGDGTAKLAQGDDRIITVSIHGEKNFPFEKQRSDIDVNLDRDIEDEQYLECVNDTLTRAIDLFKPDAVIYDAGADIHCDDSLGHFNISLDGIYQRDLLVFQQCSHAGLPVSATIGGGYQRDVDALTEVHLQLFKASVATE